MSPITRIALTDAERAAFGCDCTHHSIPPQIPLFSGEIQMSDLRELMTLMAGKSTDEGADSDAAR